MAFSPFRVVTVVTLVSTTTWVTPAAGGVLLSTIPVTPATGNCITIGALYTGTAAISQIVFPYVV